MSTTGQPYQYAAHTGLPSVGSAERTTSRGGYKARWLPTYLICALALFIVPLVAQGQLRTDVAAPATVVGQPAESDEGLVASDSRWLSRSDPAKDTVLVFVHGLFGDTVGTWTNKSGKTFFQYVAESPVGPRVDMFAFGYPSNYIASGSFNVIQAANSLSAKLQALGVMSYRQLVLVTHSLGGLVAMRALISNPELRAKVPLVIFYATPQQGADIANIASRFLSNPALVDMNWADRNTFLQGLLQDWNSMSPRPKISCGYEVLKTGGTMVVPWTSSTRICIDEPPAPISGSDHVTIVKPDRPQHDSLIMLINAVNRYALEDPDARLAMPDFQPEGARYVYNLKGAQGKARIINESRAKAYFYIKDVSDDSLYIVPEESPQILDPFESKALRFNLLRYSDVSEYSFVIRSGSGEERQVFIRVQPKVASAERERSVHGYLEQLTNHLEKPDVLARLAELPVGSVEALHEEAHVAYDYVSAKNPDIPMGSRWVLAADTLSSARLFDAAIVALQRAETASPQSASAKAVQELAGAVAAQASEPVIFRTASTPYSDRATGAVIPWPNAGFTDIHARLSGQLKAIPALRNQGLLIEGDAFLAKGNRDRALKAYLDAASIGQSPATEARIQLLDPSNSNTPIPMSPNTLRR